MSNKKKERTEMMDYDEWLNEDYDRRQMIDEETWFDIWDNGYSVGYETGERVKETTTTTNKIGHK